VYYEAVSYVWGEPEFTHYIRCRSQDSHLKITLRMDSLLRHLRKETTVRRLWIDAICLNQADNEEKSVQVQLMGEIYSQARKVHIWLGDADSNTPKSLHFCGRLLQ